MATALRLRGLQLYRSTPLARLALVGVSSSALVRQQEGYVARNERLKRPTSPHVGLLARNPDAVWMLSFAHRTTGVILTLGVSVTALEYLYYVSQGKGFSSVVSSLEPLTQHPWLWTDLKFILAFPLTFHFFNGIRHLYWDTGRGFGLKFVYGAGYTVLVVSLCTAIGLALYTTK